MGEGAAPAGAGGAAHSPVEPLLLRAGAKLIEVDGAFVAQDFGSPTSELAICMRAVGIADRSDLALLELTGHAGALAHTVERLAGARPSEGQALRADGWWCAVEGRMLVICERARRPDLRTRIDTVVARAPGIQCRDIGSDHTAVSVVGPKARTLLQAVEDMDDPQPGCCGAGVLAGAPVFVLCESETQFLLAMRSADEPGEWQALLDAGRDLGVSYVGRDALHHYALRAGMQARHATRQ